MTWKQFEGARGWWNAMNLRTRRDLIKQFRLKDRPDFSYERLALWEQRMVDDRYANYKRVCEKLGSKTRF